jgi:hypothetical protein
MKTPSALIAVLGAAMLAACAGQPAQPQWREDASSSLAGFSDDYLKGQSGAAAAEFARARDATASTGRLDMAAHAELVRCATRVASLEYDDCPGFAALAPDASAAQRAYAAYLAGQWQGLDPALLPAPQRAVVAAAGAEQAVLAGIEDPLSRLVAAGVLLRTGRIVPADMAAATATASEQGWRRPLLMWLGVALKRAQAAGDTMEAARIERRISLAAGKP